MLADDPHDLARPLRPQSFGATRPNRIADPLVEPAWPGVRVLAAVGGGRVTLWSEGEAVDRHDELRTALARTIGDAARDGAIFDGYLTKQVASEGIGIQTWINEYPTVAGQMSRMFIGGRRNRLQEFEQRREAEVDEQALDDAEVNLVLVDLLWLDGQWLLDVPLLERRRILDSILPPGQLVRPGPFVRQPIGSWIGSWRAQGFRAMTFKAANSRYRPGQTADDWTQADMPRR
jgi:ATP dependent DNA ligase domain